jgi:hypothetical protein
MLRCHRPFRILSSLLAVVVLGAVLPAAARAACPCSIWPTSVTPGIPAFPDSAANELGVRFRSDQAGYIKALRFYKGAQNTGTHVGKLWTANGSLLASATYTNETPSGWQEVQLAAPVAIQANTTYVVSYHTDTGWYAYTGAYFTLGGAIEGTGTPPLRALNDGELGRGNGVYRYGASRFPDLSWNAANYWVDVVFDHTVADLTPPTVSGRTPAPGATGVALAATVTATFSEPIDPETVAFSVTGPGGAVAGSTTYDGSTRTATFTPSSPFAGNTTYSVTLSGAEDLAGNPMSPLTWSFTTAEPPPPPPPPTDSPVLLVRTSANPYTSYLDEIMRAEGVTSFAAIDASVLDAAALAGRSVVVLGEVPLTTAQVTALTDFVTAGGSLVAMRPDAKLAPLLGLVKQSGSRANAYLGVAPDVEPGAGITSATMQYHGSADLYTVNGATTVAALYSSATVATANPAVTVRSVGPNGGQAAAFTFDLARSVVQTHQGNPAWAGQSRDDLWPIRAHELFRGVTMADWTNLAKVHIPQADEQQRLLVNVMTTMSRHRLPLPRLWYFPRRLKAVVVATGDDHGGGGTQGRFQQYLANSPPGCSVATWTCPRATSFLFPDAPLTRNQAQTFDNQGFELALHPDTGCEDVSNSELTATIASDLSRWRARYSTLPSPVSNRTHCLVWSTWLGEPTAELANGMRLDANYYFWPPQWIQNRPGFMSGSGIPMRFAATNGAPINVFQTPTAMTDESNQTYPFTIDTLLDRALGPEGWYGAFTTNFHTDGDTTPESDEMIASAQERGVPLISARQLLRWVDAREASRFTGLSYDDRRLTFALTPDPAATDLTAMVPTVSADGPLVSLTRNGSPVTTTVDTIKGVEYAFFTGAAGTYVATYGAPPPAAARIADVRAGVDEDGTPTVTWTTSHTATTEVRVGDDDGILDTVVVAEGERRHRVELPGLRPGTTYRFRVRAHDTEGRATLWPPAGRAPAELTTPPADTAAPIEPETAIALPDGTASFSWSTSPTAASAIEVGTSPGDLQRRAGARAGGRGGRTATVSGLRPGSRLHYRIAARGAGAREERRTAIRSLTVPDHGIADSRLAQWRAGTPDGVVMTRDGDGELRLAGGRRTGRYVSRVLDAQQMVMWRRLVRHADLPAGARVAVEVRLGSTDRPDRTWTGWFDAARLGDRPMFRRASRRLQYRLTLTAGRGAGPVVHAIGFTSTGRPLARHSEGGR